MPRGSWVPQLLSGVALRNLASILFTISPDAYLESVQEDTDGVVNEVGPDKYMCSNVSRAASVRHEYADILQ